MKARCPKGQQTTPREAGIVEDNCNQKGGKENKQPQRNNEKRLQGNTFNMKASAEIRPGPNPGSKGLASPLEASLA